MSRDPQQMLMSDRTVDRLWLDMANGFDRMLNEGWPYPEGDEDRNYDLKVTGDGHDGDSAQRF